MNQQTGKTFLKKKQSQPFLQNFNRESLSCPALFLCLFLLPFSTIAQQIETVIQKGHELAVLSIAVSPDSMLAVTASRDKAAIIWDMLTGREVRSLRGHQASVTCAVFNLDGKAILTGSNDKTL